MATLTGSTIASSYEQLLSLPDGGGNTSSLVAVTDGDGGTTFCISLTDASTGKAVLAVDGSHASGTEIQIDNSAGDGDSFLSFQLGGTSKFTMGVDDGDSDKFKIGTTAIGTDTALTIEANQAVTMPNQPAFLVHPSSTQSDIAMGTDVNIDFGTKIFDTGAGFNTSSATVNSVTVVGHFIAPVAGRYQLSFLIRVDNIDADASHCIVTMVTDNRAYTARIDPNFGQDPATWTFSLSVLADMDECDFAYLRINSGAGTAQMDIITESYFSGYLAC